MTKSIAKGIVSIVLGAIAIFSGPFGILFAIPAIILGLLQKKTHVTGLIGLILGGVGLIASVLWLLIIIAIPLLLAPKFETIQPIDELCGNQPVCGMIHVQCITTPCDPVQETFGNICEAEERGAFNITEGPCPNWVAGENIQDFESCATAGMPVMESYPRQCRWGDTTYTEVI